MSDDTKSTASSELSASAGGTPKATRALPRWKIVLLTLAGVSVITGLVLQGVSWAFRDETPTELANSSTSKNPASPGSALTPHGLDGGSLVSRPNLPGDTGTPDVENRGPNGEPQRSVLEDYSPALVKGGLGFFIGFCIGYALRSFVKISAIILGVVFLAIFALAYWGAITIDWDTIQGLYDSAVARISTEAEGFRTFIAGSVPVAGLAGAGLYTGIKRK